MEGEAGDRGVVPVPREARPYQGRPAGLVTRLVAGGIDAVVVGLMLLGGYFGFAGLVFLIDPRGFELPHAGLVLSLAAAECVAVPYLTLSWTIAGRTYGCLVMGLRVVGPRGRPLGLVTSALRAVLVTLVPIGILWVAVSRERRSVQDIVLGTRVIYDWQPRTGHGRAQG